ncbi:predicted protein, partial [Nematostella vectensis]
IYSKGEDCKPEWKDAEANFDEKNDHLQIMGKPVMERWETPYMHKLASIAASNGGRVLEIGFGLAISATKIQSFPIDEHVIIECNDGVFKRLEKFAENAAHKVTPKKGLWEDVVPTLEDNSFDGILYDTYPLMTCQKSHIRKKMYVGGGGIKSIIPGNISSGKSYLKYKYPVKRYQETQISHLVESGFAVNDISTEVMDIDCEEGCKYYSHNKMIAPTIKKAK